MGKGILIYFVGAPLVCLAAFQIACLMMTAELNPLMTHDQYIQIRGVAFLLMFPGLGLLAWLALAVISKTEKF